MSKSKPEDYYSVTEVSKIERLPYHKIIRLIKAEESEYPNAYKVGWGWVIPKTDVDTPIKQMKRIKKKLVTLKKKYRKSK